MTQKQPFKHNTFYLFLDSLRLVRDGKVRGIGIICFRADNYAVAKEISVNKYCTNFKTTSYPRRISIGLNTFKVR